MSTDKPPKKNERSHEENQERAYIAASRRADRSIEARVQSARMASEIHKKRTGKGFKISEEIVMKEEMYEEEEDDFPRQLRFLGAHMRTGNPAMNERFDAYLTNSVAVASINMARANEMDRINTLFAQQFPGAAQQLQQSQQKPMYPSPFHIQPTLATGYYPEHHVSASYTPTHPALNRSRAQSIAQIPPHAQAATPHHGHSPLVHAGTAARHASLDDHIPPALTPGSTRTDTPFSNATPPDYSAENYHHSSNLSVGIPVDPSLGMSHLTESLSSFTSELPGHTKSMTNGLDDEFISGFYGENGELTGPDFYRPMHDDLRFALPDPVVPHMMETRDIPIPSSETHSPGKLDTSYFINPFDQPLDESMLNGSRIGTPGGGLGDSWESWIADPDHPAPDSVEGV